MDKNPRSETGRTYKDRIAIMIVNTSSSSWLAYAKVKLADHSKLTYLGGIEWRT